MCCRSGVISEYTAVVSYLAELISPTHAMVSKLCYNYLGYRRLCRGDECYIESCAVICGLLTGFCLVLDVAGYNVVRQPKCVDRLMGVVLVFSA
jgi:hypothetical protein